jgi:hypothetical protein
VPSRVQKEHGMTQGRGVLRVEDISWESNADAWPWGGVSAIDFLDSLVRPADTMGPAC